MEKLNENEKFIVSSSHNKEKEELWKILNEARFPSDRKEYNSSFDDGNNPGGITEHTMSSEKKEEEKGEVAFEIDEQWTDNEVFNRVQKHENMFPINDIIIPRAHKWETMSFMIKQEKLENKRGGRNTAVWAALPADTELRKLWEVFSQKQEPLRGTKVTYITFSPTKQDPLTMSITATIIEYPVVLNSESKEKQEVAMIPNYVIFKKEIKGKDVEEMLKNVA